eukprot:g2043.t1
MAALPRWVFDYAESLGWVRQASKQECGALHYIWRKTPETTTVDVDDEDDAFGAARSSAGADDTTGGGSGDIVIDISLEAWWKKQRALNKMKKLKMDEMQIEYWLSTRTCTMTLRHPGGWRGNPYNTMAHCDNVCYNDLCEIFGDPRQCLSTEKGAGARDNLDAEAEDDDDPENYVIQWGQQEQEDNDWDEYGQDDEEHDQDNDYYKMNRNSAAWRGGGRGGAGWRPLRRGGGTGGWGWRRNTLLPTGGNLVLPFQLFLPGLIGSAAMFERWHRKVLFPEAEEGWCDVERSLPPDKQPRHPHSGAPALGAPTGNAQHSDINSQHFQVHSGTVETDEDPKPSQTDSSGDEVLPPGTELGAPEKQSVAEEHRMSVAETIEWANRHISAYLTTESGATHFVAFQSLAMAFDLFVDYSMTQWRGAFFDTFQSKNVAKFKDLLQSFGVIATSNVIASAYSDYMTGLWDLHSRGYLVREFSANAYFKNAAFYKMTVTNAELRNCDQRLHEDVQAFVSGSRRLTLGLADAVLRLLFFFPQLVYHSPPGLWELCVVMAIVSSVTTHHLGKDLMPANMAIQNAEAGFRDSLISVRERSEPLALQGNDDAGLLQRRFRDIKIALWNSMQVGFRLQAFTSGYGLCAGVVPFLLLAPSYFNGAITMGAMFQLESIIGQVQGSLDFFMSTYADFASWRVTTDRLIALEDFTEKAGVAAALRLRGTGGGTTLAITDGGAVDAAGCGGGGDSHGGRVADEVENSGTGLDVYFDEIRFRDAASSSALEDDSTSSLPLHLSALRNVHFTLHAGDKRLILGDAAAGKSVFVRCLAGIWPDKWMGPKTDQTHLERCAATALLDAGLPDWVAGLHERHFDAHVSTEVRGRLVFAQLYLLTEFRKFFVVDDFPTKQNLSDTVTASLTKKFLEKLDSATHGAVFFGRPRNVAMKEVFSEVIKGARAERLDALSGSAARNL